MRYDVYNAFAIMCLSLCNISWIARLHQILVYLNRKGKKALIA